MKEVICRVGSLEIMYCTNSPLSAVICRVGSLEIAVRDYRYIVRSYLPSRQFRKYRHVMNNGIVELSAE